MSVIFIVLPLALLVVAVGVAAWVWAVRSGQFDDTTTPPVRTVFEDDDVVPPPAAGEAKRDPDPPERDPARRGHGEFSDGA